MKKHLTNQPVASILLKCRETVKKLTVFFVPMKLAFPCLLNNCITIYSVL